MTLRDLLPVVPYFVDEAAATGLDAAFEVRLTGGERTFWYFDQGRLTAERAKTRPVDCRMSAEPVTFLLIGLQPDRT